MTACLLLTLGIFSLYCSIIKRLDQYDEFYPAFQSLVSELKRLLSEYFCNSASVSRFVCHSVYTRTIFGLTKNGRNICYQESER